MQRLGKSLPDFAPGDTVVVSVNVVEGERKRVQAYEGVVIARRNRGLNSSFIVRKISSGEGVERTFQTYSPLIASIEVKRRGDVRRAKLYYLRSRSGKSARIREKIAASSKESCTGVSRLRSGRQGRLRPPLFISPRRGSTRPPTWKSQRADYQARVRDAFAVLGVRTECDVLVGIDFLALDAPRLAALDPFTGEVCRQLRAYLDDPHFRFDLPIAVGGTVFQRRVWDELARIPCGETRTYAEVAARTGSGARAVGNACGANRVPLVIPCHRVVGSRGLGGFMNAHGGFCPRRSSAGSSTMSAGDELLDLFCDALWLEDGLSRNTLQSYRTRSAPVRRAGSSSAAGGLCPMHNAATCSNIWRTSSRRRRKPRTTSRLLSSLKRFYGTSLRQGRIQADPTLQHRGARSCRAVCRRSSPRPTSSACWRRPNPDTAAGPARPRHARDAVCERLAGVGAGGARGSPR